MKFKPRGARIAAASAGIVMALVSVSTAFALDADVAPDGSSASPQPGAAQDQQQQIINNYQCYGGGSDSTTICIFKSININLACNVHDGANAGKNLALLQHFFRVHPDARLRNIDQRQWQQITNNYQCYGGGDNSVTICNFSSVNINGALNANTAANQPLMSYFFSMYPNAKRLNARPANLLHAPDDQRPTGGKAGLWKRVATLRG